MPKILKDIQPQLCTDEMFYHRTCLGSSLEVSPSETSFFQIAANELGITTISIVDHMRCKAFGLKYMDLSPEEEFAFHIYHLDLAKEFLGNILPEVKVRTFVLTEVFDDRIEPVLTEIKSEEMVEV